MKTVYSKKGNRSAFLLPVLWRVCLLIFVVLTIGCDFEEKAQTEYSANKRRESGETVSPEEIAKAVGRPKYDALVKGVGQQDLDLLSYGAGKSNVIDIVNGVSDANKLVSLMTGTNRLTPNHVLELINAIDDSIISENPASKDTVGKMVNMVNQVNNMQTMKDLVMGAKTVGSKSGLNRLGLMLALVDEHQNTMPEIVNQVAHTGIGLTKLLRMVNEVTDIKRMAQVVNGVTALSTIINVMNSTDNPSSGPTNGTTALIYMMNTISNISVLAELVNGVSAVNANYLGTIMNHLNLAGNGHIKMLDVVEQVIADSDLSITTHLVRLLNDISSSGLGAENVATIMNNLDQTMVPKGTERIVYMMRELRTTTQPYYTNAQSTATNDQFGRLSTMINVVNSSGAENITQMMNGVSDEAHLKGMAYLVRHINNVQVVADFVNGVSSIDNVITIFNGVNPSLAVPGYVRLTNMMNQVDHDPHLTVGGFDGHFVRFVNELSNIRVNNVVDIVNGMDTNAKLPGGSSAQYRMIWMMSQMSSQSSPDNFGKLINLINGISSAGTTNIVTIVNSVSNNQLPAMVTLTKDMNSVSFLADMINGITNVSNVVALLNNLNLSISPSGSSKMVALMNATEANVNLTASHMSRLVNDLAAGSAATVVPGIINGLNQSASPSGTNRMVTLMSQLSQQNLSNRYHNSMTDDTGLPSYQRDYFGRLTTLVNGISGSGASNIVSILNGVSSSTLTKLGNMNKNVRRIKYMTEVINNLVNVSLIIFVMDNAYETPLLRMMNEIGDNTYKGGIPGQKTVGNMDIMWQTMNELMAAADGTPLATSKQQRITRLINEVNKCGIQPGYDLNSPQNHLMSEDSSSCMDPYPGNGSINGGDLKTMSIFMLGMQNARPAAVLVGSVTDTSKTIKMMNGSRDIQKMIDLTNYIPPEVMAKFVNSVYNDPNPPSGRDAPAIWETSLYLMNRLTAKDIAATMHYGAGIGSYNANNANDYSRTGPCHYYPGLGPVRMANLMNSETGQSMYNLLSDMGTRLSVASMACGFGTPNADTYASGSPQTLTNQLKNDNGDPGSYNFYWIEGVTIYDAQHPPYTVSPGQDYVHWYYHDPTACVNNYYPEYIRTVCSPKPGTAASRMDRVVYNGASIKPFDDPFDWANLGLCTFIAIDQKPGLAASWDLVNERGFLSWLSKLLSINIPKPANPAALDALPNCYIDPAVDAPVHHVPGYTPSKKYSGDPTSPTIPKIKRISSSLAEYPNCSGLSSSVCPGNINW